MYNNFSATHSAMDDNFGLESNANLNLIAFDEQQKVKIGAALQALADQMVPSVERQLLSNCGVDEYNNESHGSFYVNKLKNVGYSMTNNPKQKDETFLTFPRLDGTYMALRNKGEAVVEPVISNQHFSHAVLETSNWLSNHFTLMKEEPKLEIKPPAPDDDTLSACSEELSYSNERESIDMRYMSDEGSDMSNNCSIEKDGQNIYSIESNSQDDEEFVIDYKSIIHYLCPECGVDCGPFLNWKLHTDKQHKIDWLNFNSVTNVEGESCYQCLDCSKKFSAKIRLRHLQEHRIKHFPHRYYIKCSICDKRFDVLTNVYLHIKQTHANLARPYLKKKYSNPKMKYIKIFCPICQQSQPNIKRWEQHLTEKHDYEKKIKSQVAHLGKNMYLCHLCEQKIHQTYYIKIHMLLHEPNKSFQCILCEKFHTHLNTALQHMSRKDLCNHQNKLLKCSYCDATFANKSLLSNHNRNFHKNEMSKHTVIKNLTANEDKAVSGVSNSINQLNFNYSQLGTTNNFSTIINLTKEESQLQKFEVEPSTAGNETFSSHSRDLNYCNKIESINMQHISDEGSGLSKTSCSNEEFVDSLESDPQGNQNDELESDNELMSLMQYSCPECGVDCGPYSKWIIHTEKQHEIAWPNLNSITNINGESFYQCLYCNKKLSRKMRLKLLQEHHIKHLPHKYYIKCGFCDKRFQVLNTLYLHIKKTHAKLARPYLKKKYSNPKMKYINIFCPICQQSQSNIKRWEQHLLEEHDYDNKIKSQVTQLDKNMYSCNLCQKKIRQPYQLKLHMLLHEPNKSFQCILCKKYDTHLSVAVLHISRKHPHSHQNKFFECSYCKLTFVKKSLLWNHNQNFHKNEMSEHTVIKNVSTNEDDVESGVSNSINQLNFNHSQVGTTNNLSTNINLTKKKSQLQRLEVEPPAAGDETFLSHSRDFSYSNEIEFINMQHISEEESGLSKNYCSNEKHNEDFVDSLESESQGNQNHAQESDIEYKSFVLYVCPECGVNCGPYSKWVIHTEKQHKIVWPKLNPVPNVHGESCYDCLYCNKKLSHKMRFRLVQEHHIKHMPHKYYLKCGFCDKRYQALSNVYGHIKRKHENLARPYFKKKYSNPKMKFIKILCPICQQSQPNIKCWQQHLTEKHDYDNKTKSQVTQLGKNTYRCQFCLTNIRRDQIRLHMLSHERNKSFQCILCKTYATQLSGAVKHMSYKHSHIHPNKLFKCSYCKLTFAKKLYLQNHNKIFHKIEILKHTAIKYPLSSNEDETEVDSGVSSSLNQPHSNQDHLSTNELLICNILTKEEPQLQEFEIEYTAIDEDTL